MPESVYKVVELVGTSTDSWERAAAAAVEQASKSIRDLRVAEVVELDMQLADGNIQTYRAKVKLSFKFEGVGEVGLFDVDHLNGDADGAPGPRTEPRRP